MKKLLSFLIICLLFSSCTIIHGVNYDNSKKVQKLQLGMDKEEAIAIMGKEYIIESTSREKEGTLEILRYYSPYDVTYLLHFLDGNLISFNKYYPPHVPQHNVTIKHE